ncbi:MAG: hybrid sensor histidine kinase/response regulator [bacterium]|nr:hybrid sensor histidine kinase/response regulator [bacterium]
MSLRRVVPASGRTILVVDDQHDTLSSVRMLLEREGHRVLTASRGEEALELLARETVQLLLVDWVMPEMSGEQVIAQARARDTLLQIVLQTGYAGATPPRELLRSLAIQGYHDKSEDPERLLLWVDVALKAWDQLSSLHGAERVKTELLANVSHEFRTPLNIIVGYLDLLREGTFGSCAPEASGVLEKVRGNAGHLLDLVEEFLDLSQLEAGALRLRNEAIDLLPLLRELGEAFALLVRAKPVAFVADLPPTLPLVEVDGAKLKVVVQNLLANAAKFTDAGEIRLSAGLAGGTVWMTVADTGPGIPPEAQERIFDAFHQLQPHDGERKGIGLGLALARRFARLMRGDLDVESRPGTGARFRVTLPAARAAASRAA